MITKQEAVSGLQREYYFRSRTDGKVKRCRRMGKCQTWKTRPEEFKLPMKFGMYESFYITHENAHTFFLTEIEAAAQNERAFA